MIRYTLRCSDDHRFDSWFASADAYDSLQAAGRLSCAVCGSMNVTKAVMAPPVRSGDAASAPSEPANPPIPGGLDAQHAAALQELRRRIETESTYVGPKFAEEARAIHEGTADERMIHGEARGDDVRALLDDGVPIAPLPFLPTRKVN